MSRSLNHSNFLDLMSSMSPSHLSRTFPPRLRLQIEFWCSFRNGFPITRGFGRRQDLNPIGVVISKC